MRVFPLRRTVLRKHARPSTTGYTGTDVTVRKWKGVSGVDSGNPIETQPAMQRVLAFHQPVFTLAADDNSKKNMHSIANWGIIRKSSSPESASPAAGGGGVGLFSQL